jgi:hypothetical protein
MLNSQPSPPAPTHCILNLVRVHVFHEFERQAHKSEIDYLSQFPMISQPRKSKHQALVKQFASLFAL